ncbi:hypothetical protein [Bacillus sp. SG-1]|uniref:hypothetical protein n=1 Tax=Bacillus sp. SG-1 TaxID=161544 RepID=UPI0001545124|nr:hypothetical protein [Bacillus sp. SG-1]EDL64545.1 hypothetical protein BSG1_08401 [Bacillus sp. SG-1]
MDRLFGALIISLTLLTTALVSVILTEGGFIIAVICIGLAALIGITLMTNGEERPRRKATNGDVEKVLEDDLTKDK